MMVFSAQLAEAMGITHRVHILLEEGNPIFLVFQNIDPPFPSPPGECVLPPERGMGGQHFGRREK
jgi:hypothetical protein